MQTEISASVKEKPTTGATPFDAIISLEEQENQRVEQELQAMQQEKGQLEESLEQEIEDEKGRLKKEKKEELIAYKESDLAVIITTAEKKVQDERANLRSGYEAKKQEMVRSLAAELTSSFTKAA